MRRLCDQARLRDIYKEEAIGSSICAVRIYNGAVETLRMNRYGSIQLSERLMLSPQDLESARANIEKIMVQESRARIDVILGLTNNNYPFHMAEAQGNIVIISEFVRNKKRVKEALGFESAEEAQNVVERLEEKLGVKIIAPQFGIGKACA